MFKPLLKVGLVAGAVVGAIQLARKFELDKKAAALASVAAEKATEAANNLLTKVDDFFLGIEEDEEEDKASPAGARPMADVGNGSSFFRDMR